MTEKKAVTSAEGVLVRLKTYINERYMINAQTMKILIDEFVSKRYGRGNTKSHFDKVNIYNEMTTDRMTIKVFFKYLRIIKAQKVTFKVTVVNIRGKEVTVEHVVNLPPHQGKGETDD